MRVVINLKEWGEVTIVEAVSGVVYHWSLSMMSTIKTRTKDSLVIRASMECNIHGVLPLRATLLKATSSTLLRLNKVSIQHTRKDHEMFKIRNTRNSCKTSKAAIKMEALVSVVLAMIHSKIVELL